MVTLFPILSAEAHKFDDSHTFAIRDTVALFYYWYQGNDVYSVDFADKDRVPVYHSQYNYPTPVFTYARGAIWVQDPMMVDELMALNDFGEIGLYHIRANYEYNKKIYRKTLRNICWATNPAEFFDLPFPRLETKKPPNYVFFKVGVPDNIGEPAISDAHSNYIFDEELGPA